MSVEQSESSSKSKNKKKKEKTEKEGSILKETKLKVQLEDKPNELVCANFKSTGELFLSDVTGRISKFIVKY